MRHRVLTNRFGMKTSRRRSLVRNLACALIENEQIITTLPRASALRPIVEKMVTKGRSGDLSSLRNISSELGNKPVHAKKVLGVLSKRYMNRPGGYLRILKCGFRYGDAAPMAIIEFVDRNIEAKGVQISQQIGATEEIK